MASSSRSLPGYLCTSGMALVHDPGNLYLFSGSEYPVSTLFSAYDVSPSGSNCSHAHVVPQAPCPRAPRRSLAAPLCSLTVYQRPITISQAIREGRRLFRSTVVSPPPRPIRSSCPSSTTSSQDPLNRIISFPFGYLLPTSHALLHLDLSVKLLPSYPSTSSLPCFSRSHDERCYPNFSPIHRDTG